MCGERLDKVISRLMPEYSRSRIQQWIDDGFVTVDGKSGKGKQAVLGHEVLIIEPQTSVQDLAFEAEDIPLNVVFEDDTLIVIHKPAGMVVHPAAGNWTGTLLNGLLHRWPALKNVPRAGCASFR
jgi:23S rRNA pseudouridine1911/1915/1917 synthase